VEITSSSYHHHHNHHKSSQIITNHTDKVFPPHARPGADAEERLNLTQLNWPHLHGSHAVHSQCVLIPEAMFSRPNVVWDTLIMLHPRDFDGIFPSDGFSNHFDGIFPSNFQSINPWIDSGKRLQETHQP